jgi:hypothetical protein
LPEPGTKKRRRKSSMVGLWVFVGLLSLGGIIYLAGSQIDLAEFFRPSHLWKKLGLPILRTTAFISLGLLVGQLIESLGWTARLGRIVWPAIRWAKLPEPAGAAFTAAFISGVLANSILVTAWQEEKLDKKGLVLSNLLANSLPMFVLHVPTTLFITVSLTGSAGLYYMSLMFAAALLRFFGVAAISRMAMPDCPACTLADGKPRRPWRVVWAETWPKFKTRLKRLIVIIVPVYFVVVLLAEAGFFNWMRDALADWVVVTFLPIEAMSLIVFSLVAEFTSGFAAAGALLQAGSLGVKEAVLALMIGNVISTPIRSIRHQMPQYLGLFTPSLGLKLILIGQSVRVTSVILVTIAFALLY